MRNRLSVLTVFAALLTGAFFITESGAQPNSVKKIADGVWFREGDIKNLGHCNNTIIEMKDYLIVVDANFPSGARLAMADAQEALPKPVKYVFITHHHGDHDYGAAVWTASGATTLAYKGVAEEMKRYEPKRWQRQPRSRPDVADLKLDAPEPAEADLRPIPFRPERFHPRSSVPLLRLGAHARRRLRLAAQRERPLHRRRLGQRPLQLHRRRDIGNWPKVMAAALKTESPIRASRAWPFRRTRDPLRPGEFHDRTSQGGRAGHSGKEEARRPRHHARREPLRDLNEAPCHRSELGRPSLPSQVTTHTTRSLSKNPRVNCLISSPHLLRLI